MCVAYVDKFKNEKGGKGFNAFQEINQRWSIPLAVAKAICYAC